MIIIPIQEITIVGMSQLFTRPSKFGITSPSLYT